MNGMKGKTINAIITKKVNQWIESIDDAYLQQVLRKNVVVTGGCIASMLLGEDVNDFDIYPGSNFLRRFMNIAVVILWYLIGYVGCVWAVSRKWDVVKCDLLIFMFLAIFGPLMPIVFLFAACDLNAVVIRRRK